MNIVCLTGYMYKPVHEVDEKGPRARFRLSVPNGKDAEGKPKSFFITVRCIGNTADAVANYGADKRRVAVTGQLDIWTTAEGKELASINFARVEFLDKVQTHQDQPDEDVPF